MLVVYDIEVIKYNWLVVFKIEDKYKIYHNNVNGLRDYINELRESNAILVGFNNYHYDDPIIACILNGGDPYELSNKIILEGYKPKLKLNMITLDVMQELPLGVGLKSSQANIGLSIVETPIDFTIDRELTKPELRLMIDYCKNDVRDTERILLIREDYFTSKMDLVKEFDLPAQNIKCTRAVLSSKILKCVNTKPPRDRLYISYIPELNIDLIPTEIIDFYNNCENDYRHGVPFEEIEKRHLEQIILGVPHTYGFGGLHGAVENYKGEGNYLHIDVGSFYPAEIIEYGFMSRASKEPTMYKVVRDQRMIYKKAKDPRQGVYKIVLNSTFGAMKSQYNALYDPKKANDICINGQLILTQLLLELGDVMELIQSNTDGIVIKYIDKNYDEIVRRVNDFGSRFRLSFDIDKINKIAQPNVNNYVMLWDNGKIEAKGRFKNFETNPKEPRFISNTLSIIDRALVNYYIYDKPIEDTVLDAYQSNDFLPFQIIAKMGKTFDGMYYEYNGKYIETQKVNRVFATSDKNYGGIYKRKGNSYNKIADTSENCYIHNEAIEEFNKSKLDLNYYINLIKNKMF